MKSAPVIFLTALAAFALSFGFLVLAPQIQVGRQSVGKATGGADEYPKARAGQGSQGAAVYKSEGCAACHSQVIREGNIRIDLILKEAGTNAAAVVAIAKEWDPKFDSASLVSLPQTLVSGMTSPREAGKAQDAFTKAGATADVWFAPQGADIARGWGMRGSVAADYLFDTPVQLGSVRVGPDLSNVGLRATDANWQYVHLYNPRALVKGSPMAPYPFLFKKRKIIFNPSGDALKFPEGFGPQPGYEIVPTGEAKALLAYLQSLRVTTPVYEAPMSVVPPVLTDTNAVANTNAIAK